MKSKLLFFIILLWANLSHAKYIYEYLGEVEPLLIHGKYSEADKSFNKLNKKVKQHAIKGWFLSDHYKKTVEWLKNIDSYHSQLLKIESNMALYKASGNGEISLQKCNSSCDRLYIVGIDNGKPRAFPFSDNFMVYINKHRNSAVEKFNTLNTKLTSLEKVRIKKARADRDLERKRKKEARIKKQKEEKIAREIEEAKKESDIKKEVNRIDLLSKSIGYLGYEEINVIKLIYETQKNGGLENYLNKVVGCHDLNKSYCKKWYPKLKALQILDDAVLYSFSEYGGNEYLTFTVLASKDAGKIYQEGQAFSNSFHAFVGMTSYKTVTGALKTVPVFKAVNFGAK